MRAENLTTLTNIRKAAKAEFLAKGFKSASLRNIVKTAGLTTGAFYGYYGSKEELFCALVDEPYQVFHGTVQAGTGGVCLPSSRMSAGEYGRDIRAVHGLDGTRMYMRITMRLNCCCAVRKVQNMRTWCTMMVEIEVAGHAPVCMQVLRSLGRTDPLRLDPQLEHILVSGMFTGFFEMVVHDMPQETSDQLSSGSCAHFTPRDGKKLWGCNAL